MGYLCIVTLLLQVLFVENKIITIKYEPIAPIRELVRPSEAEISYRGKTLPVEDSEDESEEDDVNEPQGVENNNTPCTVVVVSNIQSPKTHTLMRKYRYDKNGVLIPGSVKYYMKRHGAGANSAPSYVPMNDKAFSPHGGFIRYYKEVPPIPRIW